MELNLKLKVHYFKKKISRKAQEIQLAPPSEVMLVVEAADKVHAYAKKAAMAYSLEDCVNVKALLIRCEDRTGVIINDDKNGWGRYVAGEIDVVTLPCNHKRMFKSPNAEILAGYLIDYMK